MRETSSGLEIDEDLKLTPDQVAVYYFHPEGKGSTKVIRIRIDRQGELLTEWPGGFFSERERELFS
jgi:predicted ATPase